jgi:hypothetical protein
LNEICESLADDTTHQDQHVPSDVFCFIGCSNFKTNFCIEREPN